ncbi:hypothetical protein [Aeromonas veronii]|uniref:hypothetical protein n=1 Tax=Aeromonas veronii TaxID=654 RepID=UPI0032ECAC07
MSSVFFSGSISIKSLPERIQASVDQIKDIGQYNILVGDAAGFDILLQEYCRKINFTKVTVYSISEIPRNYIDGFKLINVPVPNDVKGERKRQTFKDERMTLDSDISFIVWDEKSTGSYNNIIRALRNEKKVRVFSTKLELPINEITEENITKIYHSSNGLTASDVLNMLYENGVKEFDDVKKLNAYLVSHRYISKSSEENKSTYKTLIDDVSFNVMHRGKHAGIRFRPDFVKTLITKLKAKNNNNGYGGMRG